MTSKTNTYIRTQGGGLMAIPSMPPTLSRGSGNAASGKFMKCDGQSLGRNVPKVPAIRHK